MARYNPRSTEVRWAKQPRICDLCAGTRPLVRFQLTHTMRPAGAARTTTRGCGAIFLCERCWKPLRARTRAQPIAFIPKAKAIA